jgi:hypothetical protein
MIHLCIGFPHILVLGIGIVALLDDIEIRRRWSEQSRYNSVLTFEAGEQPDDLSTALPVVVLRKVFFTGEWNVYLALFITY